MNLRRWDVRYDAEVNKRRPRALVREMLNMNECPRVRDRTKLAEKVPTALTEVH